MHPHSPGFQTIRLLETLSDTGRWVTLGAALTICLTSVSGCNKSSEPGDPAASTSDSESALGGGSSAPAGSRDQSSLGLQAPSGQFAPPVRPPAPTIKSDLELPGEADQAALVAIFADIDNEMQRLSQLQIGPEDRDTMVGELTRLAKMKETAADRLLATESLEEDQRTTATRAKMQAFSHQAALGDLKAAEALEEYAVGLINSPSNDIARDSRTVLVSFALERLQGGVTDQPEEVLRFVSDLASRPEMLDASSVMAMRQAMVVLGRYGYTDAAEEVRALIENTFVDSTNPEISQLVTEVLSEARFNILESMRAAIRQAGEQSPDAWRAEAEKVAQEKADLLTLQYLVSLSLQLESMDLLESAAAIYGPVEQYFAGSEDANVAEAAGEAVAAFTARQNIIGKPFTVAATETLTSQPLNWADFEKQIVLIPYWAVEQLDSLGPIQGLQQLAAKNPDTVKILGVNMDSTSAGRTQASQLAMERLNFPNIAATAAVTDDPAEAGDPFTSPLVKDVGIVSIPVVVVVDQQGNVAAVALGYDRVEKTVADLLAP